MFEEKKLKNVIVIHWTFLIFMKLLDQIPDFKNIW